MTKGVECDNMGVMASDCFGLIRKRADGGAVFLGMR